MINSYCYIDLQTQNATVCNRRLYIAENLDNATIVLLGVPELEPASLGALDARAPNGASVQYDGQPCPLLIRPTTVGLIVT